MVDFQTFVNDCNDFRQKLGSRDFWELPCEKRDDWHRGLGWAFMMLKCDATQNEKAIIMFESASDEYARRNAHILVHGLPWAGKESL